MANSAYVRKGSGIEGISAMLRGLPAAMKAQILEAGMNAAARPLATAARRLAPVRSGALKRSITHVTRKYNDGAVVIAIVGPDREYYSGGKRLAKGAARNGADRPANYAHLAEYGHFSVAPKKGTSRRKDSAKEINFVPAKPFMRPAMLSSESAVVAGLADGLTKGLEKARAKLITSGAHVA